MERHIAQRWDDEKLHAIATRFGTNIKELTVLDGFESFIYEYERAGQSFILRIGHSNRRSENLIHGEVDWLNYLAEGGANVAQAITSNAGNLVESIDDGHGGKFLATAFVKAQGQHLAHQDWTPTFVQHYGETIGLIHRLSKTYTPSNPSWKRYHWDDAISINLDDWAQIIEPRIMDSAQAIMQALRSLTHDETYHMIHQDAHGGNFYVDDNQKITLFDFDECAYGHEIYDIAMVIFYGPVRDDLTVAIEFARNFLIGYVRENSLDPKWLAYITPFMTLREIDLYALIERDVDWRTGEDLWAEKFMIGRRERLLNHVPFVDYDFKLLASILV